MAKQGRCQSCNIVYTWSKEVPLKNVKCQSCGKPLARTSNLFKGKIKYLGDRP